MKEHYENHTKEEVVEELISVKSELVSVKTELGIIKFELAQIKRMIFGTKSERFIPSHPDQQQLLFDEPIVEVEIQEEQITYNRTKPDKKNNHKGRLPIAKHLPRVDYVIEPEENVDGLIKIGEEVTEELEYTPGKFFVNRYIRPKYAKENKQGILIASLPSRPIEKGIAGPGLLSSILIEKYVDHLPLHRQIQRFKREKINIAPSTIGDWVKYSCELLTPLYGALKKEVLASDYIMVDETPIKVLDKDKEDGILQGYYWVYRSVKTGQIIFDYRPSRKSEGPTEILENYQGFLQTDGYKVYDEYENRQGITLLHCMAHARRYFEQALGNDKAKAEYFLTEVRELYATERKAKEKEMDHQQRLNLRQKESIPILERLGQWLKDNEPMKHSNSSTPRSPLGKAILYALNRWDKLSLYAHHGHLEIDNNPVENAIRPVALGRKNYLFAGSNEAAQRAAMIYSFFATCKANDVEPYEWIKNVLTKIPDHKANQLKELLPIR